jgi:iron complex outermembrane receptor protein
MVAMHRGRTAARNRLTLLAATSLVSGLVIATGPAHAFDQQRADQQSAGSTPAGAPVEQSPPSAASGSDRRGSEPSVEDIVVTGSRASVNGFSAPSALSVIGADIIGRQSPTSIGEVLQLEPAFKATRSQNGNANNFASPGQSTADLRGLGGQRTLVLVNGSRVVPQAAAVTTGAPVTTDLNVIPTNIIDRVEVVTGGASAQYGSDAVAGVVNILLKRKMEGLELTAQSGISDKGDNFRYRLGAVGGFSFAGGRGQFVGAIEAAKSAEIADIYQRDWGRDEYLVVANGNYASTNPAAPGFGLPANVVAKNVRNSNSIGGRITGPANFRFNNYTFDGGGTIRPYQAGSIDNGTYQLGGEGLSRNKGSSLIPGVKRVVTYARASYEVSDALNIIVEGGYAKTTANFTGGLPNFAAFTIRNDNAFLPQAVKTAMAAQGLTSITVSKGVYDVGNINFLVTNKTPHGTVGIEGDLGGSWRYDAHYSYGQNKFLSNFDNNFSPAFYNLATDAVVNPATNQIVCRSALPGAAVNPLAAGCQPINIFGPNAVSGSGAAALAYVNRADYNAVLYKQHAAAVNMRGEPFSTWAGPVAIAFGGEYRKETQDLTAGPLSTAGRFAIGNATPFSGSFDVKEGYVEAIVPLARDLAFAHALSLNGAFRYADYSNAGGQTTWKVGGVYEPVEGLRFRATRSRDLRAPAIYELFSPGSSSAFVLSVNGRTAVIPQNRTVGNPALRPEVANTVTLGIVLQPRAVPGLNVSVDYYKIDLADAIDSLSAANIGNFCTAGEAQSCSYITFAPNGMPTALVAPVQNIAEFKTSGIDAAVSYRLGIGGSRALSTRFSGTYSLHAYVNGIDRSGENGQGSLGSQPRFRGNWATTYSDDVFSLTGQLLYISKGTNDNQFNTIPALSINDNSIVAAAYVNLYATLKVTDRFELNANVDNLLDRDPPVSPYAVQGQPVNGQLYDKIGRAFEVGAKLRF